MFVRGIKINVMKKGAMGFEKDVNQYQEEKSLQVQSYENIVSSYNGKAKGKYKRESILREIVARQNLGLAFGVKKGITKCSNMDMERSILRLARMICRVCQFGTTTHYARDNERVRSELYVCTDL